MFQIQRATQANSLGHGSGRATFRRGFRLSLLLVLVFSCVGWSQSISGPKTAKPGDLVTLSPVDVGEARTFWNLNGPESFEQFAEEGRKLFIAMPNQRVSFSLFVIPNDTAQPIRQVRHVIEPAESTPPVVTPPTQPPVVTPPINPPTQPPPVVDSPLKKISADGLATITDAAAKSKAVEVAKVYQSEADAIDAGKFPDLASMMLSLQEKNRAVLSEHRQLWEGWRLMVNKGLNDLKAAGKLPDVKSHGPHWRAIAEGLK